MTKCLKRLKKKQLYIVILIVFTKSTNTSWITKIIDN